MHTRRAYLAGAAGVAGALAGCAGGSGESTSTTTLPPDTVLVELVDYAFEPGTESPLEIDVGTTVRFHWKTGGHDIRVPKKPAESDWTGVKKLEKTGYTTEHTFRVPGTYHIYCTPHQNLGMVGDIVVKEKTE